MTRTLRLILPLILAVAACGTFARDNAKSARLSLPMVEHHLDRGLAAGVAANEIDVAAADLLRAQHGRVKQAIESGERAQLVGLPLTDLRAWTIRGVDERLLAREVGPHVADSLRNNVDLFFELLGRLAQ